MPREMIGSPVGPFHVKVGWDGMGSVQVGVEGDDGKSLNWLLYESDLAWLGSQVRKLGQLQHEDDEQLGRSILNTLDVFPSATAGGYAGVWSDLGREGCNRLIRILRKARDASFGRDE